MNKENKYRSRTQGAWLQEVAAIDLQIREDQTEINKRKAHISLLLARKREILEANKPKRRRCTWDENTPFFRLVNLSQLEQYKALIREWQKRSTEIIDPLKTSHFTFLPKRKYYVTSTLANMLSRTPPVFKVSMLQLCQYLSEHSNLGSVDAIRKAIQRVQKCWDIKSPEKQF